ncbi:hypothetical protein K0T92_14560 [Paenibacillus oenotherae]|uniref:Uncharacterized protein n=1 Tax=Paenibacillus oenotherae TaxID=1435645 RepID=A0ABS7D7W4_9BACL|nr:hypothetical protein [Paenibacillus oenotherae]MBW7475965.1 hypothetical protein [Paenibacillus oenotherae]
MALKISKNAGLTDIVADANPITTEHPITGSAVEVRLWLFNDSANKRYTTIALQPTDITSPDDSGWVQLAPDVAGVPGAYLAGGAALSMADISDSGIGKPYWVKVTTPSVADSQNKADIKLTVTAKEYAV